MTTISCSVGYRRGGLGQHFAQLVEDARALGTLRRYFSSWVQPGDEPLARAVRRPLTDFLMHRTPVRYSQGWRWHLECDSWDRKVARLLEPPVDSFTAFAGQALHSFRAARRLGCNQLELIASNSHVENCVRQHAKALARHPGIEHTWLNDAHRRKTLAEYAAADTILVASEYTRRVFAAQGVRADKLARIHYTVDPRFTPDPAVRPNDGVFRIVYVGSVTVVKGVPVLLDALARLRDLKCELTLVGGTSTRGMRKYVDHAMRIDSRIRLAPGDPLPHLRRADLCVHPSWEDGLAYAPLEALAAGVPVVVSHDTGMKEYVTEGANGHVLPTGNTDALVECLDHLAHHRLPVGRSLLPPITSSPLVAPTVTPRTAVPA